MTGQLQDLLAHLGDPARCSRCVTGRNSRHPADAPVRVFAPRKRSQAKPRPEVAAALRSSLGVELRALRASVGLSQWRLSVRAGTARSTVEDLEAGRRRPSPSMLASLVLAAGWTEPPGVAVSHAEAVSWLWRLVEAAGPHLVVDTPGGVHRRARRLAEAERRWRWRFVQQRRAAALAEAERRRALMARVRALARAKSPEAILRAAQRLGW